MIRRICIRCGHYALPGGSRCPDHATSSWDRYNAKNPERARFYKSGGWTEARRTQLRLEPDCRVCGRPATEVDHIVPLSEGGEPFGPNLQSLCADHHHAKTVQEGHAGMKRKARRRADARAKGGDRS